MPLRTIHTIHGTPEILLKYWRRLLQQTHLPVHTNKRFAYLHLTKGACQDMPIISIPIVAYNTGYHPPHEQIPKAGNWKQFPIPCASIFLPCGYWCAKENRLWNTHVVHRGWCGRLCQHMLLNLFGTVDSQSCLVIIRITINGMKYQSLMYELVIQR